MAERVVIAGASVLIAGECPAVTIYALRDDADRTVYVGSTSQPLRTRIRAHVLDAKNGSALPVHKWMRARSLRFSVVVLERFFDRDGIRVDRERHWVSQFDCLLNMTDGGPGGSGSVWSADRRERLAQAIRSGAHFHCQICGARFWRKLNEIRLGNAKFCSRPCYAASLKGKTKPMPAHVMERGVKAAAQRKRARTHCINGHEFTPENTRTNKNNARVCRTCERAHKRKHLEKARA